MSPGCGPQRNAGEVRSAAVGAGRRRRGCRRRRCGGARARRRPNPQSSAVSGLGRRAPQSVQPRARGTGAFRGALGEQHEAQLAAAAGLRARPDARGAAASDDDDAFEDALDDTTTRPFEDARRARPAHAGERPPTPARARTSTMTVTGGGDLLRGQRSVGAFGRKLLTLAARALHFDDLCECNAPGERRRPELKARRRRPRKKATTASEAPADEVTMSGERRRPRTRATRPRRAGAGAAGSADEAVIRKA